MIDITRALGIRHCHKCDSVIPRGTSYFHIQTTSLGYCNLCFSCIESIFLSCLESKQFSSENISKPEKLITLILERVKSKRK